MPNEAAPTTADLRKATVLADIERGKALHTEWVEQVNSLLDNGLVDFKMKLNVGSKTTTASVVSVLTNALRLRATGKTRPLVLDC